MKEQVAVIGDSAFNLGFALAGVRNIYTVEDNPREQFEKILENDNIGILVSNEHTMQKLSLHFREQIEKSVKPVLVVLSQDDSGQEVLRQLILKSIGVDLWGKDDNDNPN